MCSMNDKSGDYHSRHLPWIWMCVVFICGKTWNKIYRNNPRGTLCQNHGETTEFAMSIPQDTAFSSCCSMRHAKLFCRHFSSVDGTSILTLRYRREQISGSLAVTRLYTRKKCTFGIHMRRGGGVFLTRSANISFWRKPLPHAVSTMFWSYNI
jgi:hypothetical protein